MTKKQLVTHLRTEHGWDLWQTQRDFIYLKHLHSGIDMETGREVKIHRTKHKHVLVYRRTLMMGMKDTMMKAFHP